MSPHRHLTPAGFVFLLTVVALLAMVAGAAIGRHGAAEDALRDAGGGASATEAR